MPKKNRTRNHGYGKTISNDSNQSTLRTESLYKNKESGDKNETYENVLSSSRKICCCDYISSLSIDDLISLHSTIKQHVTLTISIADEKTCVEFEKLNLEKEIEDLNNSLMNDYNERLKQLAEKQRATAIAKLAYQNNMLTLFLEKKTSEINNLENKFPGYDFNVGTDMSVYIMNTLKLKQKEVLLEKQRYEAQEVENKKKEQLAKKHSYVTNRVIEYLDDIEFIQITKLHDESYLDELIKYAHSMRYTEICIHNINLTYVDCNYFINQATISCCNGWMQYEDAYDEDWNKITEPCCHKRFATGVRADILTFNNVLNFDVDSTECKCVEKIRIE
jgi:hypothetical protein